MEPDHGKLFIGGISWDTDEERLKEYFRKYGEVVEAVIMRDRVTGRARGFGFVVFADPAVAERVVMDKHMIDCRTVEAKKAVPKEDQHILNRTGVVNGSSSPGSKKKIFVGGLASTVTESDFKKYFDQFGTVTDVVVMYDHNTQRPRGFGFISYDSEEAVDRVLHKTFHELNGKMVEVKRAVPKGLSPGPSRSPMIGHNYSPGRTNSFLNSYAQSYNMSPIGGFGISMDTRFSPISSGRSGLSPFGPSGYGLGMNLEPGLRPTYGGNSNFGSSLGYARLLSPFYNGNSNRYNTPIGYNVGNGRSSPVLNTTTRNVWGNNGINNNSNPASIGAYLNSSNGGFEVAIGNNGSNWGANSFTTESRGIASGYNSANGYGSGSSSSGLGGGGYGRNGDTCVAPTSSFPGSTVGYEGSYGDLYQNGSVYGDSTWRSSSPDLDGSSTFGYGLGDLPADITAKSSGGYIGGYNVTSRQPNRGNYLLKTELREQVNSK